jgi:hypothetical protein
MSANMIRLLILRASAGAGSAVAQSLALALLLSVAVTVPAGAAPAPQILYTDPTTKPAETAQPHVLTPFGCAGIDTLTLGAALAETLITGDTTGGPTLLSGYGCLPWSEQGPEHIYRLEVTEDLQLWAGLSDLGANDLDLFLLDGCDTDQCLVGANTELQMLLPAGTYWLVVDGYGSSSPAAGPYTLTLETRWPGVPPQICQAGGATEVTCAGATIPLDGDLLGAANLLQAYECSPSLVTGGEQWYAVALPGLHQVSVRAAPAAYAPTLDLVLWLFDGCGAAAACLNYIDLKAGGQVETLLFENLSADPVTVYLAVDARRAPTVTGSGDYSLDFVCQTKVANEVMSAGSVKGMWR